MYQVLLLVPIMQNQKLLFFLQTFNTKHLKCVLNVHEQLKGLNDKFTFRMLHDMKFKLVSLIATVQEAEQVVSSFLK